MEEKKQGFLGAYKCLVLFAVMMIAAVAVTMIKPKAETYTATAKGFAGEVTVQVSIANGEITAVQILDSTETAGIADPALEQIPAAIVAAQSTDVDTIAGCTYASKAIITAVNDCLVQAGLAEPVEETTAAPVAAGAMAAGTYTAEAQGMGKVVVTITVDEAGNITECTIDASGETTGIGDQAAAKLQTAIVESQGEIEGVSGASITSGAVKTALADCMAQAASN